MTSTDDTSSPRRRVARADLCAGGAFVALGAAFAIGSLGYDIGSALEMGPGYVPLVLGGALAALGVAIVLTAVAAARVGGETERPLAQEEPGPVPWRRGGLLVAAVVVFGLTVDGLGLGVALFLAAFLAALAGHRNTVVKSLVVAVALTALCLVVFVAVLQLRLPVFGEWLGG